MGSILFWAVFALVLYPINVLVFPGLSVAFYNLTEWYSMGVAERCVRLIMRILVVLMDLCMLAILVGLLHNTFGLSWCVSIVVPVGLVGVPCCLDCVLRKRIWEDECV